MITKQTGQTMLVRDTGSFRGASAIYYATLVLREVYPIFVWSFYLLTAILLAGIVSSNRRRR